MVQLNDSYDFHLYARSFQRKLESTPGNLPFTYLKLPQVGEKIMPSLGLIESKCKGDLYHATDHYLPLKKPQNAVATIHDLVFEFMPNPNLETHVRQKKLVPDFAKSVRRIITVSKNTKRDLGKYYGISPDKVDVVYPAADQSVFNAKGSRDMPPFVAEHLPEGRPYFLAISCNTERKNTPRLLEAYVKLLEDDPKHDFVIAWNPPDEIREKFQHERIHFTGYIPEDQLGQTYRAASAILYPSLYEGFGLPVLEALSCGTPVLTSNNSSLPEVGGDAAYYVDDPTSVDSICAALARFESSDFDPQEMQEKARNQASKFSWESCAKQTIDSYRRALEEGA